MRDEQKMLYKRLLAQRDFYDVLQKAYEDEGDVFYSLLIRFKEYKTDCRMGVLSYEQQSIQRNRFVKEFLDILDD